MSYNEWRHHINLMKCIKRWETEEERMGDFGMINDGITVWEEDEKKVFRWL